MKYFSRFVLFLFCVLPLQAAFADEDYLIRAPEMIGFSPSIQIDQKGSSCDWIKPMFPHFLTLAEHGEVVIPASDPRATPYTLSIDFLSAEFEGEGRNSRFAAHVRGEIRYMGKLVATRDFKTYEYFKPNQTPCPAMRALAISISKSLDSWTQDVELRPCTEGCTGLHPETPILVAFPIQMQDGKSADPEMLAECGWQDYMRPMILDAYKRELRELEGPAPEIEIRTEPFENPNGRTLKLTLVASHVIGGSSFTGPKWLNVHAELLDGGVAVDLGRGSGWLMGGYMNRCHNLTELSRKVAYDIARMLARPGVATREVY